MALVENLNSTNLEILNQGNDPTFCNGLRLEAIDITLRSFGVLGRVKSWEVSIELCQITDVFCSLYRAPYRYVKSGTAGAPNGTPFGRT